MGNRTFAIGVLAAVLVGGSAALIAVGSDAAQTVTGPIARYDMRAGTTSGMGAMGGGGSGGGIGAGMAMMFGGGGHGGPIHDLTLELGSNEAPNGGPAKGDHFMPAAARLGLSVPLETPQPVAGTVSEPSDKPTEHEFRRPQGRMLIFWGCGEHAPANQPVVIDFAKLAAGQIPPGLFTSTVPQDRWVHPGSSRTYGHWPNSRDHKALSADSSLIGAHKVSANYAPEMAFTLQKDFMAALAVSSSTTPAGAIQLQWNALPGATGYYASLIGGKGGGRGRGGGSDAPQDIVWWTSAASREFGGGLQDWLSPGTVARLVDARTVMAPQTTTCTIPAEVHAAAPGFMMTTLIGYGPEERFAYPPRPADPRVPWHIAWEARIRHRSITSFIPGMPGMGDSRAQATQDQSQQPCPPKKRRGFGGIGGLIGGALGGDRSNDSGC